MVPPEEEDKKRNKSSVLQEQERLMQGFTMPCEYISKLRGGKRDGEGDGETRTYTSSWLGWGVPG